MMTCPTIILKLMAIKSQFRVIPSNMFNLLSIRRLLRDVNWTWVTWKEQVSGLLVLIKNLHPDKRVEDRGSQLLLFVVRTVREYLFTTEMHCQ